MPTFGTTNSAPSRGSITQALRDPGAEYWASNGRGASAIPGTNLQSVNDSNNWAFEEALHPYGLDDPKALYADGTVAVSGDGRKYAPSTPGALGSVGAGAYGATGGGLGSLGGGGGLPSGSGSGSLGGYELPSSAGASQSMRDLQLKALAGMTGLMGQDTTAQRKAIEDALYATSSRGINTAADRARMAMLEGTFARGVGSSSITTELAGRQQQEHSDALAQAAREAFTQAGSEQRADLASQLGLNTAGFNSATAGLQGEANVSLANLARMQQESQFSRNLGFQGSENALNRAQSASQFGQNLGLQRSQLDQQNSQFGQSLAQQNNQFGQNLGLSYAQLGQNNAQFNQGLAFTGGQNDLNRQLQTNLSNAQMQQALAMLAQTQGFQGTQNQLNRDWQAGQNTTNQTFAGQQNQLTRDQQMQLMLLQLANQQQIAGDNRTAGAVGAGIGGLTTLVGPMLAQWAKQWGE